MAARTDLLLDANGDLPIYATLMTVGPSDKQHVKDMFRSFTGEWKQFIFNGIGTARYLKSTGNTILFFKNAARQQLQNDGYNVGNMQAAFNDAGKLTIKPAASR